MRVLVCGAAGFLGNEVVRACVGAGHDVRGLVRSSSQRELVAHAGGTPVVGSVLELPQLERAIEGCEAVIHLAQARGGQPAQAAAVRVQGATNLLRAARSGGAGRLILGSGYWVYRSNPGTITEESPLEPLGLSRINYEAEEQTRSAEAGSVEVVIVRPGMVYGPGSWLRSMVQELRTGEYRYVGAGENRLSPVSLEDTGEAFRRILESAAAGSTYLVVDDRPVTTAEFARYVADRIGARPPRGIAFEEAAREWGADLARLNAADRAASNARLRSLGWAPRYPAYRDGIPSVLASFREP
jgi:nucleoside-diphosphate-sugar epimerase